jgi:hypothetical protein
VPTLLTAAVAIRGGNAPVAGPGFQIMTAQGMPMAAAYLANAIAWRRGGNVAVITPSLQGNFARDVVQRVCQQACGRNGNGPYAIRWERSEGDEVAVLIEGLKLGANSPIAETLAALDCLPRTGAVRQTGVWVRHQARPAGRTEFGRVEIEEIIARQVANRRQRYGADNYEFMSMTVQQAKNREFDGVVVLWPYQVGGDAEHRRRLLYNAVTRAQRWCTIIAQGPELLQGPPFG